MLAAPAMGANPASIRELDRIGGETERVSAAVGPKVVQIVTQSLKVAGTGDEQPAGVLVAERGRGSGFFVAADGYLFTNRPPHAAANALVNFVKDEGRDLIGVRQDVLQRQH